MAKIKAWSDHIIRHFWYCSSVCKESENTSDEEALQIMKVGEILLHVIYFMWNIFVKLCAVTRVALYISHNADCLLKTSIFFNWSRRPGGEMSHLLVALWDT